MERGTPNNSETNEQLKTDFEIYTTEIDDLLEHPEKTEQFIENRFEDLEKHSAPETVSFLSKNHRGYINSNSEIKRSYIVDGFKVNDKDIYSGLMDTFRNLKQNGGWENRSTRDMALYAIQYELGKYFGNHFGETDTENANQQFYMNHSSVDSDTIDLAELKGKNIAVCAEKAAVAENLLAFLGAESEVIIAKSELNPGKKELHMYNVISSSKGNFIYDPTNPQRNHDKKTNSNYMLPALYKITSEQYQQLHEGQDIEVEHTDIETDENGQHLLKSKRVYGGIKK